MSVPARSFKAMKIACVGSGWYPEAPGGLEKYLYGLTHALLREGDSVDLFVTGRPFLDDPRGQAYSIGRTESSFLRRMVDARLQFARSFRGPYDAINLHFAMTALPLIPFIDHRTPRIVNFQGPWGAESRAEGAGPLSVAIKTALERFVYRRSDRFIVLSNAFKEILIGYGIDAMRIHVIPIGIDCDVFSTAISRASVRAELGWPKDATVFFTARRLVNRVGIRQLLLAARLLRDSGKYFVLKIAGRGRLRAQLATTIEAFGLLDYVELLGFVSEADLVRAYQASDVVILPTQSLEGFGTIIAESLSCGTPVIVTPVGGMAEAVAPLSSELVMRSASPEDIAASMASVIDQSITLPDERGCREYAVANFNWDVVVQQVRAVFAKS